MQKDMKGKGLFFAVALTASLFMRVIVSVGGGDYEVEIVAFYSCDRLGGFQNRFERGTKVYFNLTVRNLGSVPKNVSIHVTVYDGSNVPIGYRGFNTTLPQGGYTHYMINITIPEWANVGEGAHGHANIFEEAFPLTPEKTDTFEIIFWRLGDINGDGVVSLADVGKIDLVYSRVITEPAWVIDRADINGDGVVSLADVGKTVLIYSGHL
jgi:hypothetical protein